jgi:hypothetical protein
VSPIRSYDSEDASSKQFDVEASHIKELLENPRYYSWQCAGSAFAKPDMGATPPSVNK